MQLEGSCYLICNNNHKILKIFSIFHEFFLYIFLYILDYQAQEESGLSALIPHLLPNEQKSAGKKKLKSHGNKLRKKQSQNNKICLVNKKIALF